MAENDNKIPTQVLVEDILDKIVAYEKLTDLISAKIDAAEIEGRLKLIDNGPEFRGLLSRFYEAKRKVLGQFAEQCPNNGLEYRTQDGYCALTERGERLAFCKQHSNLFGSPQTDKEYCRACLSKPE